MLKTYDTFRIFAAKIRTTKIRTAKNRTVHIIAAEIGTTKIRTAKIKTTLRYFQNFEVEIQPFILTPHICVLYRWKAVPPTFSEPFSDLKSIEYFSHNPS